MCLAEGPAGLEAVLPGEGEHGFKQAGVGVVYCVFVTQEVWVEVEVYGV